jgi:hypothetical protein
MSHPATANLSEAANGLLFEVLEYVEGSAHFARIKSLSNAKKFTVTKVTPYYGEGIYGEMPTNNEPAKYLTPIAELEVIADLGNSNTSVRLLSPIISSDVIRLLGRPLSTNAVEK